MLKFIGIGPSSNSMTNTPKDCGLVTTNECRLFRMLWSSVRAIRGRNMTHISGNCEMRRSSGGLRSSFDSPWRSLECTTGAKPDEKRWATRARRSGERVRKSSRNFRPHWNDERHVTLSFTTVRRKCRRAQNAAAKKWNL